MPELYLNLHSIRAAGIYFLKGQEPTPIQQHQKYMAKVILIKLLCSTAIP